MHIEWMIKQLLAPIICSVLCALVATSGARIVQSAELDNPEDVPRIINLAALIASGGEMVNGPEYAALTVDQALAAFYQTTAVTQLTARRNRIQKKLLAAAKKRCGEYRRRVNEIFTRYSLTRDLLFPLPPDADQLVSPAVKAEVSELTNRKRPEGESESTENEDNKFCSGETANTVKTCMAKVIKRSIDVRQLNVLREIDNKQQTSVENYSVFAAIGDAINLNNACSLHGALEQIRESAWLSRELTLKTFSTGLENILSGRSSSEEIETFTNRIRQTLNQLGEKTPLNTLLERSLAALGG